MSANRALYITTLLPHSNPKNDKEKPIITDFIDILSQLEGIIEEQHRDKRDVEELTSYLIHGTSTSFPDNWLSHT